MVYRHAAVIFVTVLAFWAWGSSADQSKCNPTGLLNLRAQQIKL